MGWAGGVYSRVHNWVADAAAAEDIEAVRMDQEDDSIATGINTCLTKDGQNEPTANLPMGTNRHTGVGNAAALTDYTSAADVIDQNLTYYVDSGSANTYAITPSPAISAYAEGQGFIFRATNANNGASTLNINALGAIAIQTNDGVALSGGEIIDGGYYEVVYDDNGTRFVLVSPHSAVPVETMKSKQTVESVVSSEALQDDNHLAGYALNNNKMYKLSARLACTQSTGGLKFKLNFSNAPANNYEYFWYKAIDETGNIAEDIAHDMTTEVSITTMVNAETFIVMIEAFFESNATTGGTIDLQWAQDTSNGSATQLFGSSWMEVELTGDG